MVDPWVGWCYSTCIATHWSTAHGSTRRTGGTDGALAFRKRLAGGAEEQNARVARNVREVTDVKFLAEIPVSVYTVETVCPRRPEASRSSDFSQISIGPLWRHYLTYDSDHVNLTLT